jgi:heme oxygenase (mycobilin-producing)
MSEHAMSDESVTLINVFEINRDDLDAFMRQWEERATLMRTQPGFRSFRLYRALSPDARYQLINVAEWDSEEDLRAATSSDRFQASVRNSKAQFAFSASPAVYRAQLVVEV